MSDSAHDSDSTADQTIADDVRVVDNPAKHRFDITVDGEPAGFSVYRDVPAAETATAPERILYHTVVHEQFGGRGLASTLTREAIGQSVAAGYRIVPVCPYVKSWVGKHDDFADHIVPATGAHLALLD